MASRADKKYFSTTVAELSQRARLMQLDVSEIDKVRDYLDDKGFPEESAFYGTLDALEACATNQEERGLFYLIRAYQGKINKKPVRIWRSFDNVVFSRGYNEMDFHLNHRVNVNGMTDFLELKVFRSPYQDKRDAQFLERKKHLIHVEAHHDQVVNGPMLRNRVNLHTFPTFMGLVNGKEKESEFWRMQNEARYQFLLRTGYNGIRETLEVLRERNGEIDDDLSPKDIDNGIRPISDLLEDDLMVHLLEETSLVLPDLRTRDGKNAQLFYYPVKN